MKKSKVIPVILTLLIWAGMYYYYLPALNIHAEDSWMFFVVAIAVGLVLNFWSIFKALFLTRIDDLTERQAKWKKVKRLLVVPVALCIFYGVGTLLSSPILRASAYHQL